MIQWHRLFGLTLMDLFSHSNYEVELEKELSQKKQFLDIVILRKTEGQALQEVPVGLEQLAAHNLLTYKSLREPLDEWAIEELIGHYASYRKLVSTTELLPADDFQLYEEGVVMPYTMEDFNRDFTREHLYLLPPEERLKGLPSEERLRGLPPEERLKGLPPEERLKGLPPEIIEAYLAQLKKNN